MKGRCFALTEFKCFEISDEFFVFLDEVFEVVRGEAILTVGFAVASG